MPRGPPTLVFGQPVGVVRNQLRAAVLNVVSWLRSMGFMCFAKPKLPAPEEPPPEQQAISIPGPGGLEQLQVIDLAGRATVGCNVREYCLPPLTPVLPDTKQGKDTGLPATCVLVRVGNFSVNYADITIRWGLYESAVEFVGWPIVPGFDISGVVEWAGKESGFKEGQRVFGVTLFGGYTTHCLVPGEQLLQVPKTLSMAAAAAAPAVSATALHAVALAGFWPRPAALPTQRAALVHSAAGGVGTMLLQVCRLCGFSPIVAVVGSPHKGAACRELGADVVIDKSAEDLWARAREVAPEGFAAIFDANGLSTMKQGYEHLALCGRMILYGFHSNLPTSTGALNPLNWLRMAFGMLRMPRFDGMRLVLENKAVLGFNLSFFEGEKAVVKAYLKQLADWFASGDLRLAKVTELPVSDVAEAHALIQSGKSVGKIVLRTACAIEDPLECEAGGGLMGTRGLHVPGVGSSASGAVSVGAGTATRDLAAPSFDDTCGALGGVGTRGLHVPGAGDSAIASGGSNKGAAARDMVAPIGGDAAGLSGSLGTRGLHVPGTGDSAANPGDSSKGAAARASVAPADTDSAGMPGAVGTRGFQGPGVALSADETGGPNRGDAFRDKAPTSDAHATDLSAALGARGLHAPGTGGSAAADGESNNGSANHGMVPATMQTAENRDRMVPSTGDAAVVSMSGGASDAAGAKDPSELGIANNGAGVNGSGSTTGGAGAAAALEHNAGAVTSSAHGPDFEEDGAATSTNSASPGVEVAVEKTGNAGPGHLQRPRLSTITSIKKMMSKWTSKQKQVYNDTLQQFDDNLLVSERCIGLLAEGSKLSTIKTKAKRTELFEALAKVADAIDKLNKGDHGNHDFMAAAFGSHSDVERLPRLKRVLASDADIDAEPEGWCVKALMKQDIDSMHTKSVEHLIRSYKAADGIAHDHNAHHEGAETKISVRNISETTPKASVVQTELRRRSVSGHLHTPMAVEALHGLDENMSKAEKMFNQYAALPPGQRSAPSGILMSVELMKDIAQMRDSMAAMVAGGHHTHAWFASEIGKGSHRATRLLALVSGGADLEGEATGGILKLMKQDPEQLGQHANEIIVSSLIASFLAALSAADVHA